MHSLPQKRPHPKRVSSLTSAATDLSKNMKYAMKKILLTSIAALIFCGTLTAKTYQAGKCVFELPESPNWRVTANTDGTITVAYRYLFGKKERSGNMDISCVNKELEGTLRDDFLRSSSGQVFQGGNVGNDRIAKEVKGADWHGWQVKYFQNNVCLLTVGSGNSSSSFRAEICDTEDAIEPQIRVAKNLLRNLSSH